MTQSKRFKLNTLVANVALLSVGSLWVAQPAQASSWVLEPSVSVFQKYDSNFTLENVNKDNEAGETALAAAVAFTQKKPASEIKGVLKAETSLYQQNIDTFVSDITGLETRDAELEDAFNLTGFVQGFKRTERAYGAFDLSFKRESLLRDISANVDPEDTSVDPNQDVEDGLVRTNVNRSRIIFNPRYDWRLSAISGFGLAYKFQAVTHSNKDDLPTTLSDYTDHTITATYDYRLSRLDKLITSVSGFFYKADEEDVYTREDVTNGTINEVSLQNSRQLEGETNGLTLTLGWNRQLSPTSEVGIRGGFRNTSIKTKSEFFVATNDVPAGSVLESEDDTNGFILSFDGEKRTGQTRYAFKAGRNLYGSGVGEVVQADELIINISHQYAELIRLHARTKFFQNKTLRENLNDNDRRYVEFEPGVSWNFKRFWNLDANYRYRREKKDQGVAVGESHALLFGVRWSKPRNLN